MDSSLITQIYFPALQTEKYTQKHSSPLMSGLYFMLCIKPYRDFVDGMICHFLGV